MLTVTYRKYGIRLSHVWFASEKEILDGNFKKNAGDLIFLHGASCEPFEGRLYTVQHTLIKDLSLSEDELFMTFKKGLREKIRQAKRENCTIEFHESKDVLMKPEILDVCRNFYEKMFADKGMAVKFNFENPNSIACFKMEFARENQVTYDNYLVPRTIIGKLALKFFMRRSN